MAKLHVDRARRMKKISISLASVASLLVASYVFAQTQNLGRQGLTLPDLGYPGGQPQVDLQHAAWQELSNDVNTKFQEYDAIPNATTQTLVHNFGVDFNQLKVMVYSGSHPNLTRIQGATTLPDPWIIAATSGSEKISIDITPPTAGGPFDFAIVISANPESAESVGDLNDVDITSSAPEDGQALVWDGSNFVPGASGDSSFKIQSVTDPNATIKGGAIILNDQRQLATYDGAGSASTDFRGDLVCSLDTILGSDPADNTTYSLYIDLTLIPSSPTTLSDTGEELYAVDCSDFTLSTDSPESVLSSRFVPLGFVHSADSGTIWSGSGSSFGTYAFRRHALPSVNVSPVVHVTSDTIGTLGTTGTINHNASVPVNDQEWVATVTIAASGDELQLDNGWITDRTANSIDYDFSGLAGTDSVTVKLKNNALSAQTVPVKTFDTGPLSAAPSFPLAHGLGVVPTSIELQHEGASVAGDWDNLIIDSYCSVDSTSISCDLSALVIGASNRIRIVASASPVAVAVDCATASANGLLCTSAQNLSGTKDFSDDLSVNTDAIFVDASAKSLGVGISPAVGVLHAHLASSGDARMKLSNSDTGATSSDGLDIIVEQTTGKVVINQRENADLEFRNVTGGTNRLVMEADGDVLVGRGLTLNTPADCVNGNICSGTYTPTTTGTTGCSSYNGQNSLFSRVGNIVTVSGRVDCVTATIGVDILFEISLPVASNFTAIDAAGTVTCQQDANTLAGDGAISASVANDRLILTIENNNISTNAACYFSAQYEVK